MTVGSRHASERFAALLTEGGMEKWAQRLKPKPDGLPPHIPGGTLISQEVLERRWQVLGLPEATCAELLDSHTRQQIGRYLQHIENFIGTVKLPVGIAGPLRVNGLYAQGDFYVPLATSEAALVASYNRGSILISRAGGATAALLNEGVSRAPAFTFTSFEELGQFLGWVLSRQDDIKRIAESTTRFGKLIDLQVSVEGNHLYLILSYSTGDASGQNMATIATDAAMRWVLEQAPVKPLSAFIEANFSGDKKASAQSLQGVRGKKVTAEVVLPAELVREGLHTSVERMVEYGRLATMGGIMSGTVGIQGHFANGLAGLFIACGQDAACVAEAAIGTTRMEATPEGALYVAVTLPNLIVGSVGGGTSLPSQRACLEILGLAGPSHAQALAEVAASLCLAGEISIIGAICAGEFTRAHAKLARGKQP
ncbi:3-hydroxy-3-methylglutaryl-coenzyme A reductase [Formivibrio citricus]|uniref:hydroxymethylglutaryl-CoA reductase (NADPH) n=1 Tax=Formivibrio citricus TaxID=83765 RepID=A0A1I5C2S8_9NEIS|nr:hydroxymethylglutaryl-CoA reductase [Formivibrio citricus]SFN81124.1 3-hydroxy-3-methylglutaryl-coenzyme A reductase [Formivibrio citricus]